MSDPHETCPYRQLPDYAFWKRSVSKRPAREVAPITDTPFQITRTTRIATAGSCFCTTRGKTTEDFWLLLLCH